KKKTYAKAPELSGEGKARHSFIIVGSGLIGLAVALDLARKGHAVILVTAFDFIAAGSKAICFAKQSLDIFDRLGVGAEIVARGVTWNIGKVYQGEKEEPIYQFDMLPEKNQKNSAFINIPQYSAEDIMIDALERMDNVEIRWGHQVKDIDVHGGAATLFITTRDGDYTLETDYVLACDGSHSKVRECLQLDFQGRVFEDNFLIVDVKFQHESPSERKFWFDPPFNRGRTALLHKQPDDIWRLDFQLGWDIDRAEVMKPENVAPYIKGMLGDDLDYEIEWLSVYTFQCRRMESFVHGPVIFVGDSAHLVSPFGARGANGGFSDAENIAWKLGFVIRGIAPSALLESYNDERTMGADENILHSTRATDFLTPKNAISTAFRDAVLDLAGTYAFARPFVNSGRLSTPTPYYNSQLSTPDGDDWQGKGPAPGHPCIDAPLSCGGREGWLLEMLGGSFTVLNFGNTEEALLADVDVKAVA
ncbi:MAG: FAD-dependent monooxygenase, partial [Kordiimonadaceae bacterium]|nr:FAD-dependent monooxygenase [Kordiimonadaceae bacterium]